MLRRIGFFRITVIGLVAVVAVTLLLVKTGSAQPPAQYGFFCGWTLLGRNGCHGYLNGNNYYDSNSSDFTVVKGNDVMDPYPGYGNALPDPVVSDAASFEKVMTTYLALTKGGTTYDWNGVAAAFIIDTMLGENGNKLCASGNCTWQEAVKYANNNLTEWKNRVSIYDANGWVDWDNIQTIAVGTPDSTHVCNDDASAKCEYWPGPGLSPYDEYDFAFRGDNTAFTLNLITFHNPDGSTFNISRFCSNVVGFVKPLASVADYKLTPTVTPYVNGVNTTVAQPGDTVVFKYAVANSGGASLPTDCTGYDNNYVGYHTVGSPPDKGAAVSLCSNKVFTGKTTTTLASYTVPAAAVKLNATVCSSLYISPGSVTSGVTGPDTSDEACVIIGAEPYARVYGGDVSVGNAQPSAACNPATDDYNGAGIAGWNQDGSVYGGAGTQLAAFALGEIDHFATAQAVPNTNAGTAPSGIAFANTSAAGTTYGGSLGNGALPCMNQYYSVPATATPISTSTIDLSTLASGAYQYTGATMLTIHGTLASGATPSRIQLFVPAHNVYIDNNITYAGGWTQLSDIPMFELVVNKDDINISNTVTRLDGTYVAQNSLPNGLGTGGRIATCATAGGPVANTSLYANCTNHLVVNGAFVADEVVLGRSVGTVKSSSGDAPSSLSSSAAEQFNYGPSAWLIQPPNTPAPLSYNTAVDLPPVL